MQMTPREHRHPIPNHALRCALVGILTVVSCTDPKPDVDLQANISEELQPHIVLASSTPTSSGDSQPLALELVIENHGLRGLDILLSGEWQTERGTGFGVTDHPRHVPAGGSITFESKAVNETVTTYVLDITPTILSAEELHAAAARDGAPDAARRAELAYTTEPTLAAIPARPVRGRANGESFEGKTIVFRPVDSGWQLQISDREISPTEGMVMSRQRHPDLQTAIIDLPFEPFSTATFEKPMSPGGGFFQIKPSSLATETTTWQTDIAWAIEIDRWRREPFSREGGTIQQTGSADGRIYLCFRGSERRTMQDSWIAGTFEDAPIVRSKRAVR